MERQRMSWRRRTRCWAAMVEAMATGSQTVPFWERMRAQLTRAARARRAVGTRREREGGVPRDWAALSRAKSGQLAASASHSTAAGMVGEERGSRTTSERERERPASSLISLCPTPTRAAASDAVCTSSLHLALARSSTHPHRRPPRPPRLISLAARFPAAPPLVRHKAQRCHPRDAGKADQALGKDGPHEAGHGLGPSPPLLSLSLWHRLDFLITLTRPSLLPCSSPSTSSLVRRALTPVLARANDG